MNKSKFWFYLFSILILFAINQKVKADKIVVHNETKDKIYVATYTVMGGMERVVKKGKNYEIKGNKSKKVTRQKLAFPPNSIAAYPRVIVFSLYENDLKEEFTTIEYHNAQNVRIDFELKPSFTQAGTSVYTIASFYNYYIDKVGDVLRGYDWEEWKIRKPIQALFYGKIAKSLEKYKKNIKTAGRIASVRVGNELCQGEKDYLAKRLPKAKVALEKMLDIELYEEDVPVISFCYSGGGFRAMIAALGSAMAAQEIGLIDSACYMAGLSGGTWFVMQWLAIGEKNFETFKQSLIKKTENDITDFIKSPLLNMDQIINNIVQKKAYNQLTCLHIDLYGAILANKLLSNLGSKSQDVHLSSMKESRLKDAEWILPIGTAVDASSTSDYTWFEFSPYEIGSWELGTYIPTWAFGRKFSAGKSIDFAPEQVLGFEMGIFGSAFAADFEKIFENNEFMKSVLRFFGAEYKRQLAAVVGNYSYDMKDDIPFNKLKYLNLVDAGIAFNLPFPPLLRKERSVDIIVVCDASGTLKDAPDLRNAEKFARKNKLKFPVIDYKDIEKKPVSIFENKDDLSVPMVIYLPVYQNAKFDKNFDPTKSNFCGTFNFKYSKEQLDQLSGLAKFNMLESRNEIKAAIKERIERKKLQNLAIQKTDIPVQKEILQPIIQQEEMGKEMPAVAFLQNKKIKSVTRRTRRRLYH